LVTALLQELANALLTEVKATRGTHLKGNVDYGTGELWGGDEAKQIGLVDKVGTIDAIVEASWNLKTFNFGPNAASLSHFFGNARFRGRQCHGHADASGCRAVALGRGRAMLLKGKTVGKKLALVVSMMVLAGCVSRPERAEAPSEEQPIVKSAIAGMVRVPREHRAEGIDINVAEDQKATEALRARLSSVGYRVAAPGESVRYQLKIAPTYIGPDKSRPIVGTAEVNPSGDNSKFLLWQRAFFSLDPATVVAPAPIRGLVSLIATAIRVQDAGQVMSDLHRRTEPVDALVMRLVLADGQNMEQAEILTQSYADKVPPEMLVEDSVRTMVWLLE
jgi:hypothetical protein